MKIRCLHYSTIVFLITTLCTRGSCRTSKIHPEVDMNMEQRVISHGYPVETHQVVTQDDYILTLYHIPHGLSTNENEFKNKSAILLIHGMGGCPQNFVILGSKESCPYYLADRGFDVWIFASRGVKGSFKQHRKYNWDKDNAYWVYSFHEIAVYDLTATIDFVLNYTGQEKLSLIGHSAGGNEFFAMFSEKPEYNQKVKVAISWASSPLLKRISYSLVILAASLMDFLKALMGILGTAEYLPMLQTFRPMVRAVCADPEWQKVCIIATSIIGSHKSVLQSPEVIQVISSNLPRLSNNQIIHFGDNFVTGSFRKFNYGPKKNMRLYGQTQPPEYNLSAATIPTAFFLGPRDSIIELEDVYESVEQIPNTVMIYQVPFPQFTHTDFVLARNASSLVYEPTCKLIKDIDNGVVLPPIKNVSYNRNFKSLFSVR